jgi:DNA-directed RNA polymerase subunit RPC12/RpoP
MSDSEPPRRKTLSLKSAVTAPGGPPPLERMVKPSARTTVFKPYAAPPPPPPAPAATGDWKCKPCGSRFDPPAELADEDSVRCPSCNARLGLGVRPPSPRGAARPGPRVEPADASD